MEKEPSPPKRPATAFFLFREKERVKGNPMGSKEAAAKWKDLPENEKQKYIEEYQEGREKFESYLSEMGVPPRASSRKKARPTAYKGSRVRAVCGTTEGVKGLTTDQCKGLAAVAVMEGANYL